MLDAIVKRTREMVVDNDMSIFHRFSRTYFSVFMWCKILNGSAHFRVFTFASPNAMAYPLGDCNNLSSFRSMLLTKSIKRFCLPPPASNGCEIWHCSSFLCSITITLGCQFEVLLFLPERDTCHWCWVQSSKELSSKALLILMSETLRAHWYNAATLSDRSHSHTRYNIFDTFVHGVYVYVEAPDV